MPYMTETHEWRAVTDDIYGYLKNNTGGWDVLISWKGLPRHEGTWEDYEEMQRLFPDFHLELRGKVNLEKECNDKPLSSTNTVDEGRRISVGTCEY